MASQLHYQPQRPDRLTTEASITLLYHDIFSYPLKEKELNKWFPGKNIRLSVARPRISFLNNYYFINGKEDLILKREENELGSREKMKILSFYRSVLEDEQNILFVGITGSLAMNSASKESDIDLMIIVKARSLWRTRLKMLLKLRKLNIAVRKAGKPEQANKLCINIWMDERDLKINNKNPYTAHELAQIVPLINRGGVYDRLLSENKWILDYWPQAVSIKYQVVSSKHNTKYSILNTVIEKMVYLFQRIYMNRKITREVVTPTRAFFHPMDWSSRVRKELAKRGVEYL